jgi:transcriptional regulator
MPQHHWTYGSSGQLQVPKKNLLPWELSAIKRTASDVRFRISCQPSAFRKHSLAKLSPPIFFYLDVRVVYNTSSYLGDRVESKEAMAKNKPPAGQEMLQGTMDMLILQTLIMGPAHGHTIAHVIEHSSQDVLQVEQGSLYPALHRLADRGWVSSYWGTSENNRKAKYYKLTPKGRKQLLTETSRWQQMVQAIGRVLARASK